MIKDHSDSEKGNPLPPHEQGERDRQKHNENNTHSYKVILVKVLHCFTLIKTNSCKLFHLFLLKQIIQLSEGKGYLY